MKKYELFLLNLWKVPACGTGTIIITSRFRGEEGVKLSLMMCDQGEGRLYHRDSTQNLGIKLSHGGHFLYSTIPN